MKNTKGPYPRQGKDDRATRAAIRAHYVGERPLDPEESAVRNEFCRSLLGVLDTFLTERERVVLNEAVILESTDTEIAGKVGLTRARIGLLRAQILRRLRVPVRNLTNGLPPGEPDLDYGPETRQKAADRYVAKKTGTWKKRTTAKELRRRQDEERQIEAVRRDTALRTVALQKIRDLFGVEKDKWESSFPGDRNGLSVRLRDTPWNVGAIEGAFRYGYLHAWNGADVTADVWLLICRVLDVPYVAVLGMSTYGAPAQVRIVPRATRPDPEELTALVRKLGGGGWKTDEWGLHLLDGSHGRARDAVRLFEKEGKIMRRPDTKLCP